MIPMTDTRPFVFDYDRDDISYSSHRRPDPRIAAIVHAALGPARTILNIGAGSGSYEPADRYVLAIEPSITMRVQRAPHLHQPSSEMRSLFHSTTRPSTRPWR